MKLRPMNGRVVVRPLEPSERMKGGIIIPDTAKEKPCEGVIIAMAEGATEEVALGDRVIYRGDGGTEVEVDGEKVLLLEADDLLVKYISKDEIPE